MLTICLHDFLQSHRNANRCKITGCLGIYSFICLFIICRTLIDLNDDGTANYTSLMSRLANDVFVARKRTIVDVVHVSNSTVVDGFVVDVATSDEKDSTTSNSSGGGGGLLSWAAKSMTSVVASQSSTADLCDYSQVCVFDFDFVFWYLNQRNRSLLSFVVQHVQVQLNTIWKSNLKFSFFCFKIIKPRFLICVRRLASRHYRHRWKSLW